MVYDDSVVDVDKAVLALRPRWASAAVNRVLSFATETSARRTGWRHRSLLYPRDGTLHHITNRIQENMICVKRMFEISFSALTLLVG